MRSFCRSCAGDHGERVQAAQVRRARSAPQKRAGRCHALVPPRFSGHAFALGLDQKAAAGGRPLAPVVALTASFPSSYLLIALSPPFWPESTPRLKAAKRTRATSSFCAPPVQVREGQGSPLDRGRGER